MCIGLAWCAWEYAWTSVGAAGLSGGDYWRAVLHGMLPGLILPLAIFMTGIATCLTFLIDFLFGRSRTGPSFRLGILILSSTTIAAFLSIWLFANT